MPDNPDKVQLGDRIEAQPWVFHDSAGVWYYTYDLHVIGLGWGRIDGRAFGGRTEADALFAARDALAEIVAQVRGVTEEEKAALLHGAEWLAHEACRPDQARTLRRLAGAGEVSEQ